MGILEGTARRMFMKRAAASAGAAASLNHTTATRPDTGNLRDVRVPNGRCLAARPAPIHRGPRMLNPGRRSLMPRSSSPIVGRRRVLQGAALVGAATLMPALAARSQNAPTVTPMINEPTADEIRGLLKLEPNATCGFVRVTFESKQLIAAGGLPAPFAGGRPLGSALYFLVTPEAPVRLHRIRNDQLYHYYLGDPLEVFLLHADSTTERIIVGPRLRDGQHVQLLIPGNTFHTARLMGRGRWFLGASTEWPGVLPADVEIGNLDELAGRYPAVADDLRAIAASVPHVAPTPARPR
jgi:predicted cupin superfamily sugar epimerase